MKSLLTNFSRISKDPVLFGTFLVTLGMLIGSVFSYGLQFVLSKLLTLEEFGTFNSLLSISNILGVFILVFSTALIKLTSELKGLEQFGKLTTLFWKLTIFSLIFGLIIVVLCIVGQSELSKIFNISDQNLFVSFGLIMASSLVVAIPTAYLQGLLRFKAFAAFSVIFAFLRFIVPTIFVYKGLSLNGVFFGMFLSTVLSYGISLFLLKKNFKLGTPEDVSNYYRQLMLFSVPVFFVNIGMNLLNNLDVILVKRYFSEVDSGIYSGIVTIGKILLFGAGTVSAVMFPQISALYARKENYSSKLKMFLALQLLAVGGGVVFCFLFPHFLALMFSSNFLPAVPYIPTFSIFVAIYVLLNFSVLYLLAINRTKVFIFLIPGVLLQFLLLFFFHSSLQQVINVNIFVSAILLLSVILYTVNNVSIHNRSSL